MNYLSMSLYQQPRLTMILEYRVCRQPIDSDDQTDVQVAAFGAAKYGVCCCCQQAVDPPDNKDKNYRTRWRRWRKRAKQS